jgi:hypothetical protein
MENHSKYADTIYAHDDRALFVNLFIPSELTWTEKNLTVRQDTNFPDDEQITLTIRTAQPQTLALKIRQPGWCDAPVVTINGVSQPVASAPSSYFEIAREWHDGDRVVVRLPMRLRVQPLADDPSLVAFAYGPIVLAGDLGRDGAAHRPRETVDNGKGRRAPHAPEEFVFVPGLVARSDAVLAHVQAVPDRPLTFVTRGTGRPNEITLRPLNRIVDESYTVYFRLYDDAGWQSHFASAGPSEVARRAAISRVTDIVWAGVADEDTAHGVVARAAPVVSSRLKLYRDASAGSVMGREQVITFDAIGAQRSRVATIPLHATSSAGAKVYFFVREGPAELEGDTLRLTVIPPRAKWPIAITVVAWQPGRGTEPKLQAAPLVERTFFLTR